MFGRRRRSTRWAERPSVIAVWENTMEAGVNGSLANLNSFLSVGGSVAINTFPMGAPRPCHITRYFTRITNASELSVTATIIYETSAVCGFEVIKGTVSTNHVIPGLSTKCFCVTLNPSLEMDECDNWRVRVTFSPNIVNPRFRLVSHLELRCVTYHLRPGPCWTRCC